MAIKNHIDKNQSVDDLYSKNHVLIEIQIECYELLEKIYNPLLDRISSHRDLLPQSISLLPRCLIQSASAVNTTLQGFMADGNSFDNSAI